MQPKAGGKFHPRLNKGEKPIANKYREGKVKRTLKRELKVLEIVGREAFGISIRPPGNQRSVFGGRSEGRDQRAGSRARPPVPRVLLRARALPSDGWVDVGLAAVDQSAR